MSKNLFKLKSNWQPSGDQPEAISALVKGLEKGHKKQTLLGATGTGKTFTIANVITQHQKPTLVIAHNKTLAAQLAQEFKEFFPDAAVHYFVSYYDYYQPEAYMPITDTYIEKDAQINKEIDRLRHASTQALLTRKDVIIVASVSCIYGLGSPEEYLEEHMELHVGQKMSRTDLLQKLVKIHFSRTNADLSPGEFRALGSSVEIMPISENYMISLEIEKDKIIKIEKIDPVTSLILEEVPSFFLFPAKHFLTGGDKKEKAIVAIKKELEKRLKELEKEGKLLEAERLKRRTNYDLAMIREVGYCSGIENYSRHLSNKSEGEPPETLLSYFPHVATSDVALRGKPKKNKMLVPRSSKSVVGDFLLVIDESHVTLPQIRGMYAGDQARKNTLVEYGFRLPSAKDNRPLRYEEFEERVGQMIYVSATPSDYEKKESAQVVEQIIRPTGLIDPELSVFPVRASGTVDSQLTTHDYPGQVQHFINETEKVIKNGGRVLATTLTKKMAEDLSVYLKERNIKSEYLHSDIKTIERIKILTDFRRGNFDCLVGVNLLREGLDLPEVEFIGILDADKEGFLRSETSLIQTIGRAARNVNGKVYLYADNITGSMERAIGETNRRREVQIAYNKRHGITPATIIKEIKDITAQMESDHEKTIKAELDRDFDVFDIDKLKGKKKESALKKIIKIKETSMREAVRELDFETAALLRDEIGILKKMSK